MLSHATKFIDSFIPERARRTKSDLGRTRTFVFTHLIGPTTGASIVAFLFVADPDPGMHVAMIGLAIASFWLLPVLLRVTGSLRLVAIISVQTLISVTLFGVYNYGGVSSPFLPWLLIALVNGFFYLSDRPVAVVVTFIVNVSAFLAFWLSVGELPERVPMEQMTSVGLVSVISATLYMAWMAIYYGQLLTSESALELEVLRHRNTSDLLVEAKEKAEKASRDRSIFLAKMSHELRTPLNAVIGYSELLLEDAEGSVDEQRSQDLQRINSAGRHLLSLVADVLDISQIESNEMKLHVVDFKVGDLIDDVVATAQQLVQTNGNVLVKQIDPNIGLMTSDELRLRQAILNLLSNAAKFTTKGVVTLSARRYRSGAGDWVEFEVRDSGIGISREDIKSLFHNFHQVHAKGAPK